MSSALMWQGSFTDCGWSLIHMFTDVWEANVSKQTKRNVLAFEVKEIQGESCSNTLLSMTTEYKNKFKITEWLILISLIHYDSVNEWVIDWNSKSLIESILKSSITATDQVRDSSCFIVYSLVLFSSTLKLGPLIVSAPGPAILDIALA